MAEERAKPDAEDTEHTEQTEQTENATLEPPPCKRCEGTGLNPSRKRFCSACLGSGKEEKRPYGWQ